MAPVIALLTDFGTRDPYVGTMKGVLLGLCPEASLVDITHEVAPQDVMEGALALADACRFFPPGAVFLAVVDPGVGSARRALAAEAGAYLFVGPDNGLLSLALDALPSPRVHEIADPALQLARPSATFHGRDVFAPVAGHLARGLPLEKVGPAVADPVRLSLPPLRRPGPGEWQGAVIHVDRFGNLVTSIGEAELQGVIAEAGGAGNVVVHVAGKALPLARTYSDVAEGEPCALIGSGGRLEAAVRGGDAARTLGAGCGTTVRLRAASSHPGPTDAG